MVMMMAATGGAALRVFKAPDLTIVTTDFNVDEASKRVDRLIAHFRLDADRVADALAALPLQIYPLSEYESHLEIAHGLIDRFDPKDAPLLALVLKLEIPVWSHDKAFLKIDKNADVERFTTGRLLNELGL
jgi:predicted nucleic acid-binding protein